MRTIRPMVYFYTTHVRPFRRCAGFLVPMRGIANRRPLSALNKCAAAHFYILPNRHYMGSLARQEYSNQTYLEHLAYSATASLTLYLQRKKIRQHRQHLLAKMF
jgi:hypothetical protein